MKKLLVLLVLIVSMNASAQWVQVSNNLSGYNMYSLAGSEGNIYVATDNYGVYRSTNNGANWTQSLPILNIFTFALAANGSNVFAGNWYGVWRSTNSGLSWSAAECSAYILDLATNGNNVLAGTSTGIYLSTNNGVNWTQTSNRFTYSFAVSGNNIFAGTFSSGVYLSTNNGSNWIQTALNNKTVYSITVTGSYIFAGTHTDGIYVSTNNGSNWIQSNLGIQVIADIKTMGNNVFVGTGYEGFYFSSNLGTNWIQINEGIIGSPNILKLLIANNYLYAGTEGAFVWRRPLSDLVTIQNNNTEMPSKYSLSQNYPNPFNPMTNVRFSILNEELIKLIVYDIQGREVQTLVNEKLSAGTYEVKFDGSALTSGIYFYKLSTDGFTETKKMLLIK